MSFTRRAVGIRWQKMGDPSGCIVGVDNAVSEESVAVSRVVEETCDSGGDMVWLLLEWLIEGVAKDRGRVEGRAPTPESRLIPDAGPKLRGVRLPWIGIASSAAGGTPRYSSA